MKTGLSKVLTVCLFSLAGYGPAMAQHDGFTSVYDKLRARDSTITHMVVDWKGPDRSVRARLRGTFVIAAGETGIRSIGKGGMVEFEERRTGVYRRLRATSAGRNSVSYRYEVDFEPAKFDSTARRWFTGLLREIVRETGITSRLRVERILAAGGAVAVFREIDAIESERSQRMYYERLLESTSLSPDTLALIMRRVRGVFAADRNLELLITAVLKQKNCNNQVLAAIMRTSREINDESTRAAVLADVALRIPDGNEELRGQLEYEVNLLRSPLERRRVLTAK